MIRSIVGRVVASVAATALAVGVGVVAGAGTASASGIFDMGVSLQHETVENILVERYAWGKPTGTIAKGTMVRAGDEIVFTTSFRLVGEPDERLVTRITEHGPDGFEYVPGSATLTAADAAGVDYSETVTPEVGADGITWRAPGAGWSLGNVNISVRYRAPQVVIPSRVKGGGVTFDVAGLGENLGWPKMGPSVLVYLPESVDPSGSLSSWAGLALGSSAS
ncbi:hypothetical protein [Rhodococcus sp. NPDC003348]